MPPPRRPLPPAQRRPIPWEDLRRRATTALQWAKSGWEALEASERAEVRRLLRKSKGRPRNLTRDEARRLGRLAGKAAQAARRH